MIILIKTVTVQNSNSRSLVHLTRQHVFEVDCEKNKIIGVFNRFKNSDF